MQQNRFNLGKMSHEFNVIRLWEESSEKFLRLRGLLPFAVLTQTKNRETTLSQVAQTIDKIEDVKIKSNLTASTAILAGLLLDEENISRILRSDIMRESVIYQEILAEGKLQGKLEGEQIGEQRGIITGKQEIALNLLKEARKIASNLLNMGMTVEQVAQVTELSVKDVESLQSTKNDKNQ